MRAVCSASGVFPLALTRIISGTEDLTCLSTEISWMQNGHIHFLLAGAGTQCFFQRMHNQCIPPMGTVMVIK